MFKDLGHEVTIINDTPPETGSVWQRLGGSQGLAMLWEYIDPHRNEFGRSFLSGTETAKHLTWRHYGEAYRLRLKFNEWIRGIFGDVSDLLLTPTLPTEAFPAKGPMPSEIDGKKLAGPLEAVVFTYPINLSGHPAASVRAGLTDSGLPCGLQIVAEPPSRRSEDVCKASYAYEQARPWNDKWPEI